MTRPSRSAAVSAVRTLLEYIGETPDRPGLAATPERVIRAWEKDWGSGYAVDESSTPITEFEDGAQGYSQMITQKGLPIWSHCEHHLAPFFGIATVAYIPRTQAGFPSRILGLSKVSRIIQVYARRLQVQERLTTQIADALNRKLNPEGVGVQLQCRHSCMESRGIHQAGIVTTTTALRGSFLEDPTVRDEFLRICA